MAGGGGGLTNNSPPGAALIFFLIGRSPHAHQCSSLGQDQSTVAQRVDATVDKRTQTSCV